MDEDKHTARHAHPPGGPWGESERAASEPPDTEAGYAGPPWASRWGKHPWPGGPHSPPWMTGRDARPMWRHGSGRLFVRFLFVFGLLVVLACAFAGAVVSALVLLFRRGNLAVAPGLPPIAQPRGYVVPLLFAALFLALAFRLVGRMAARRFTTPLGSLMHAADALAAGDLSARVHEQGSEDFRQMARSFNRMAAALDKADRQRRELLADVAHELRTPLSIVQGNLEGLRDGVYQPTPEHLDLVLDETHRLSRLVDDLRLLALAEAGQLPLDLQTLDVAQLLVDARETFAGQAGDAGVALLVETAGELPPLRADPHRLGQVLDNLLVNALRYTPMGGSVTLAGRPAVGGEAVRIDVADTGAGIPAEDLPRIFDRFWRADPARSRSDGEGSGLGLAICKSLVEAHGGRIWAESDPGRGTTITFELPV